MKKKRNWKDIRNAFVMFCVMVAMLSTASFAWFTLTDSPTVTSLQLTAATKGGLKVCETSTGDFKNTPSLYVVRLGFSPISTVFKLLLAPNA